MSQDDIIRLAKEAGMHQYVDTWSSYETIDGVETDSLAEFARLVSAAAREEMVAEAAKKGWGMRNDDPFEDSVREIADEIARRGRPSRPGQEIPHRAARRVGER